MKDRLPGMPSAWLSDYEKPWLEADAVAAATVWALLVPQALASSQLAGLPAVYGLHAALGALVLYPLFGSSRHLNVGPEATVATLTATILIPLAGTDPERYLALAGLLSLMVGVALALGGFLKLGVVTRFLSTPVLTGYIAVSGIFIVLGQLQKLFGLDPSGYQAPRFERLSATPHENLHIGQKGPGRATAYLLRGSLGSSDEGQRAGRFWR